MSGRDGYSKFTNNNFLIVTDGQINIAPVMKEANVTDTNQDAYIGVSYTPASASYNSSTGKLTITKAVATGRWGLNSSATRYTHSGYPSYKVYLIS